MYAATLDRALMYAGRAQKFGTQYFGQCNRLYVVDPRTNQSYVLLRADIFEKLKAVFDDDFDIRSAYPMIDAQMHAAGWDEPEWESYDVYARGNRT